MYYLNKMAISVQIFNVFSPTGLGSIKFLYGKQDWIENNTHSKELKENEAVAMQLNMKRVKYLRKAYLGSTKEKNIYIYS